MEGTGAEYDDLEKDVMGIFWGASRGLCFS